jgi:hypothetical protein
LNGFTWSNSLSNKARSYAFRVLLVVGYLLSTQAYILKEDAHHSKQNLVCSAKSGGPPSLIISCTDPAHHLPFGDPAKNIAHKPIGVDRQHIPDVRL